MTTENKLAQSLDRFAGILSAEERERILALREQPLPTGIRINPLKADPAAAILDLAARYGWDVRPIPFCENGWTIQTAEKSPGTTIEHRMGVYYLQDAASMVPVSLFDLSEPDPLVLDMAASPGGKTTHLVDRTGDRGFILANDGSQGRIPALRSVLSTWGGVNLAVTQYPGEAFGGWFAEIFDRVLLDAPCSMENLRPTPNRPLRETTPDERLRLGERQLALLMSGLQSLKPGGQLVYATCSLAPEEDEAVLNILLDRFPHSLEIQDVSNRLPFKTPGLTQFNGQEYDHSLAHALRLWPHLTGMSGFFTALIQKHDTIPTPAGERPPARDFRKTGLVRLSDETTKRLNAIIAANYGLDINVILSDFNFCLYERHDLIFLIPQRYMDYFRQLPYEWIGMPIGQLTADDFQPSPAFISRFGHQFTRGKIIISEDTVPQWIAGRDIRYPETAHSPKGQYLLVTDPAGRNLGLGKLLPKRLRNMLPR
jgi:16S rRNA (cytosine1407-C5)-methyltransferase